MACDPALFHGITPTIGTYGKDDTNTVADAEAAGFFNPIAASVPIGFKIYTQMKDSVGQTFHPVLRVTGNDGVEVITEVAIP